MGPFYYQRVTDASERQQYALMYNQLAGNDLPDDYLKRAIVYQFYQGPRPVAGFILNTKKMHPLRYCSYLSDDVREQLMNDENLKESDFLEITANYKIHGLPSAESRTYYTVMLTQAYRHARRLRKKHLLGGSIIKAVKAIQQELMYRVIYHGPISADHHVTAEGKMPLLKIYMIDVDEVPMRATFVIANRYIIRTIKNRTRRMLIALVKLLKLPRR